jgi:ribose/xylose/arabinose/galactoside ABC-type transport system permease subunit
MTTTAAPRPAPAAPPLGTRLVRRLPGLGSATGAFLALVVLVAANALFTPGFATASNFWNVLLQTSEVLLAAVGMTLVMATGGIDLSVGSVMALAGAVAAVALPYGALAAVGLALAAALAVGVVNGGLIARTRVQPIVVTLSTLIAARGLAQIVSRDGNLVTIDDVRFLAIGRGHLGVVPVQVLLALGAAIVAAFALRATAFGRYVLATGGNPRAARLAGVPVARVVVTVYAASALCGGVAGLVMAARLGASDAAKIGLDMELDAIAATVIGGTALAGGRATVLGTVLGALVMQVIATSFNMLLLPFALSLVLKAVVIVLAVYAQRPRRG